MDRVKKDRCIIGVMIIKKQGLPERGDGLRFLGYRTCAASGF